MSKESFKELYARTKPIMLMIVLQTSYAINDLVVKAALNKGLNHFTFVVYRNAIAALFFGPFAFFLEKNLRPEMTVSIFLKILLLGFIEPVNQNLFYAGMIFTTATFASSMCNILPAIAFVMAWIFREDHRDNSDDRWSYDNDFYERPYNSISMDKFSSSSSSIYGYHHDIGSGEGISGCVAAPFDPIEYPENQRHTVRGSPGLLPGRTLRCLTYRSTSRAGLYIHNFVGSCYSSPYRADLSLTAFNAFGAARTEANGGCQYVTVIDVARLLFLDQELFPVPA
ncbi:hypothetical protein LXL04_021958 [Taraxacum kok-saghyz]